MQKVGHVQQTKKFLHNKGNHQQNEKGIYWMEQKYVQITYLRRSQHQR